MIFHFVTNSKIHVNELLLLFMFQIARNNQAVYLVSRKFWNS